MSRVHTVLCYALALALALALPLSAQEAPPAQEAPLRIAVVNLDAVALQSPAGQKMQAELETFQISAQNDLKAGQDAANDIRRRAAEGVNSLSAERLAELQKEYEDATIMLRRLQDDKNREGQAMQAAGLKEIEAQLEPVFRLISDEEGYDLILNYTPGVVIMAGERVDITSRVIARLQADSAPPSADEPSE